MLVRYRMNSTCTAANMRADIDAIITGTATTVNDLSSGCDKANSVFYGTYPSAKYARVGQTSAGSGTGTDTYSKIHNDYSDTTHYFRLTYDGSKLANFTIARSYTAGTDTLVNSRELFKFRNIGRASGPFLGTYMSVTGISNLHLTAAGAAGTLAINDTFTYSYNDNAQLTGSNVSNTELSLLPAKLPGSAYLTGQLTGSTGSTGNYSVAGIIQTADTWWQVFRPTSANILPHTYNANSLIGYGIDIVVSSKLIYIGSPYNGAFLGMFDIGKNGVTRSYTDSMLMAGIDVQQEMFGGSIPHTYKFNTNSYGAQVNLSLEFVTPRKRFLANGSMVVVENPVFLFQEDNGNAVSAVYGLLKLPEQTYASNTTYVDASNVRRLTINDFSILTE